MALITCPECKKQISDSAQACPQCGAAPPKRALEIEGTKMVSKSRWLAFAGLLLMLGGCYLGGGVEAHGFGFVYRMVPGLLVLVCAAIVGQIGRSKQGRVI